MKTIYFDVITQLNGFMVACPKIVVFELAEFLDDSFLVSVVEVRLRLKNESAKNAGLRLLKVIGEMAEVVGTIFFLILGGEIVVIVFVVVVKHFPNAFRETELPASLRELGATQLVFAGMMTHMCVDTTVRAAADLGFKCSLAHDACATRDLRFGASQVSAADVQVAYLAALDGAFASVRPAAELAAEA